MTCECDFSLFVGENNVVEWQTLTNSVTGTPDTGATLTVVVKDTAGNEVAGETWPKAMAHDAGGTYRATLNAALAIQVGRTYVAEITATGSGGEKGFRRLTATAAYHECE